MKNMFKHSYVVRTVNKYGMVVDTDFKENKEAANRWATMSNGHVIDILYVNMKK